MRNSQIVNKQEHRRSRSNKGVTVKEKMKQPDQRVKVRNQNKRGKTGKLEQRSQGVKGGPSVSGKENNQPKGVKGATEPV